MAGIFGFCIKNNTYNGQDVLKILKKHALLDFDYSSNHHVLNNGAAGIGYAAPFLNNQWPVISKNKQFAFQLFGEIYLPDTNLLTPKNFELFLEAFILHKDNLITQLDGAYIWSLFDSLNNRFYLCNDPFGNFSVYYYCSPSVFLFSTQVHSLYELLDDVSWDEAGFNEFLGLGYSLNGKTYYKDIKKLQAGEILIYDKENFEIKRYLDFDYRAEKAKTAANIDIIKDGFIKSIKNRFMSYERVGAALTGGYDSRVTWGIINHLDYKNRALAFTHGMSDARDIQIARKITSELNINHRIKYFDNEFARQIHKKWPLFIQLTEGLSNVIGAHAIYSWKFLQNEIDVLLDSHGGVLFRRQFMKVAEKRIKKEKSFEEQLFNFIKSPMLALNLLKEDYKQTAVKYSLKGLNNYFSKIDNLIPAGDKIDKFYLDQISGNRYSSASNAQMNWMMLAHPFLNIESFNALSKIPVSVRNNQAIYRFIVSRTTPELKNFFLENMGMPAPYWGFTYFRYVPMIYEVFLNKTIARFNSDLYKSLTLKRFVTDYNLFFSLNYTEMKEILLRDNKSFFEIVKKDALEDLIEISLKTSNLSTLSTPLTLKLFYDVFHMDK